MSFLNLHFKSEASCFSSHIKLKADSRDNSQLVANILFCLTHFYEILWKFDFSQTWNISKSAILQSSNHPVMQLMWMVSTVCFQSSHLNRLKKEASLLKCKFQSNKINIKSVLSFCKNHNEAEIKEIVWMLRSRKCFYHSKKKSSERKNTNKYFLLRFALLMIHLMGV